MRVRFKNYFHRKNFAEFISPKNSNYFSNRDEFIAAVFLLSADRFLWGRSKCAISRYSVNFNAIDLSGISTDGYALYKTARAVYSGDSDVSLSELCDWSLLDDPTIMVIFAGVMLRRNGIKLLNWRT